MNGNRFWDEQEAKGDFDPYEADAIDPDNRPKKRYEQPKKKVEEVQVKKHKRTTQRKN